MRGVIHSETLRCLFALDLFPNLKRDTKSFHINQYSAMLSRDIAAKSFIFYETFSVIFLLAPPTSAPQQHQLHISLPLRAD